MREGCWLLNSGEALRLITGRGRPPPAVNVESGTRTATRDTLIKRSFSTWAGRVDQVSWVLRARSPGVVNKE